jgi:hypothetical protein
VRYGGRKPQMTATSETFRLTRQKVSQRKVKEKTHQITAAALSAASYTHLRSEYSDYTRCPSPSTRPQLTNYRLSPSLAV